MRGKKGLWGAGGVKVFSLFFGATQFTVACLPSESRAPELRVLRASLPYLKGFPTPILQLDY